MILPHYVSYSRAGGTKTNHNVETYYGGCAALALITKKMTTYTGWSTSYATAGYTDQNDSQVYVIGKYGNKYFIEYPVTGTKLRKRAWVLSSINHTAGNGLFNTSSPYWA